MVLPPVGVRVVVPPLVEWSVMVVPASMLASACAALLFASVFAVLVLVFMVFLLFLLWWGFVLVLSVSRVSRLCLHVWTLRCCCGVSC